MGEKYSVSSSKPTGIPPAVCSACRVTGETEIHTVAIGDYTHNRNLVLFMQTLARLNNGDFVGVSR